ncbi:MAG: glycosyltransferase [Beijerinckiaceae bacterium]
MAPILSSPRGTGDKGRLKVLYLIDGFSNGGAELGLATLVENAFFDPHELHVRAFIRDTGTSYSRICGVIGQERVQSLTDATNLSLTTLIYGTVKLALSLKRLKPNIIILSLARSNIFGRLVSLCTPQVKVITFEHNTQYQNRLSVLLRWTSFLVDAVFYDHPITWSQVSGRFYPRLTLEAAAYVPLVVLAEGPGCSLTSRALDQPILLLSAGRLSRQKNYAELIRAIGLLRRNGADIRLTIFGEGELRAELEELIGQLNLDMIVKLPGFDQHWMRHANQYTAYVQSSLFEGLCISVLQAMSVGLLVVSTDVGGVSAYGRDDINMIKSRGTNHSDLAHALERLLNMGPPVREQIADNGRSSALAEFGEDAVREKWRDALRMLEATL